MILKEIFLIYDPNDFFIRTVKKISLTVFADHQWISTMIYNQLSKSSLHGPTVYLSLSPLVID